MAQWDSSGTVTVWSNTQLPFEAQNTLAEILVVSPSKGIKTIQDIAFAAYTNHPQGMEAGLEAVLERLQDRDVPVAEVSEMPAVARARADYERERAREMPYFGQELFERAQKKGPLTDKAYRKALEKDWKISALEINLRVGGTTAPSTRSAMWWK